MHRAVASVTDLFSRRAERPTSREERPIPRRERERASFWQRLRRGLRDLKPRFYGILELFGLRFPVRPYRAPVYAFDAAGQLRRGADGGPLSTGITRGSRISDAEVEALAAQGYRGLVDLRREDGDHQDRLARSLGMHTEHVGILDNDHPTMEQALRALAFIADPAHRPVYVHCQAGIGRTGTLLGAYRILVDGFSAQQAIDEAHRYGGMRQNQEDFLDRFEAEIRGSSARRADAIRKLAAKQPTSALSPAARRAG